MDFAEYWKGEMEANRDWLLEQPRFDILTN